MNTVVLVGTVPSLPVPKSTSSGGQGLIFIVQIVSATKKGERVDRIEVSAWGGLAGDLIDSLRMGSGVVVSGRLSGREYNGKFYTSVMADKVEVFSVAATPGERESREQVSFLEDDIPF